MDQLSNLQEWLNTNDYIDIFKREKVIYRKYPDKHLMIIKRKYGSPYSGDKQWLNYYRGLIIDYKTHKIIFVPPQKSNEVQTIEQLQKFGSLETLVDGTMVNLFYVKGEWLVSTRSNIGCTNRWVHDMNFKDMFNECGANLDYHSLNKEYTYSFVMRHMKHKMISKIDRNELVLIEVYHGLNTLSTLPKNKGYTVKGEWSTSGIYKGFCITVGGIRYKWLSNEQKFINMVQPNTNNPCLNYLMLRNSGHLTSYLKLLPEMRFKFDKYRKKVHLVTQLIYEYYVNVNIKKQLEKKDVPFIFKPLLYELHGLYLTHKQGISYNTVKQYMYELEPKRLQFILNGL